MNLERLLQVVIIVWVASEITLSRLKRSGSATSTRDKRSLRLLWITIFLSVAAATTIEKFDYGEIDITGNSMDIAAVILIVAGMVIRWASIRTLWKYFTVDVSIAADHRLVTSGMYRIVRHPAYSGSILSFLGLGVSYESWVSLLVLAVPVTLAFIHRIKIEEAVLTDHFGDQYIQYAARTKRLIPKIF